MTRKRYKKLLMSLGVRRNDAERESREIAEHRLSYADLWYGPLRIIAAWEARLESGGDA